MLTQKYACQSSQTLSHMLIPGVSTAFEPCESLKAPLRRLAVLQHILDGDESSSLQATQQRPSFSTAQIVDTDRIGRMKRFAMFMQSVQCLSGWRTFGTQLGLPSSLAQGNSNLFVIQCLVAKAA